MKRFHVFYSMTTTIAHTNSNNSYATTRPIQYSIATFLRSRLIKYCCYNNKRIVLCTTDSERISVCRTLLYILISHVQLNHEHVWRFTEEFLWKTILFLRTFIIYQAFENKFIQTTFVRFSVYSRHCCKIWSRQIKIFLIRVKIWTKYLKNQFTQP
jgi:hypothetical protein